MTKKCKKCGSKHIKKNGKVGGKQLYKCLDCGKQFVDRRNIDTDTMYQEYVFGKQTIEQLSERYRISKSTIQRRFRIIHSVLTVSKDKEVIVNILGMELWGCYYERCQEKEDIMEEVYR